MAPNICVTATGPAQRDILWNMNDPHCEMTGYCERQPSSSSLLLRFRGGSTSATWPSKVEVEEITDEYELRRKIKKLGVRVFE
mmetsp:Transcript_27758/g.28152  ORF Transcript_27758/g.28152 Transcript_27758/m.28152 type:complete len:83 (-) Transcript_27758:165-413(-)